MSSDFKILKFDGDARHSLLSGVKILASAVTTTMGPSGKNVLIERPGQPPALTKDGVTVARAINLREKFQNLGVQIVREAAQSTAEEAGDGTTTATLLASELFEEGLKAYAAGHDLNDIKSGILEGSSNVIQELQKVAKSIETREELFRVANISVNGEEQLAELIVKAIDSVGQHGPISVTESKGFESSLEVVDGCEIDRGYVSPYFVNNPARLACVLENPAILVTNQKVTNIQHILHFMEESARTSQPFVIISPEVDGDALQGLILNSNKKLIKCCVLAAPEFGDARVEAVKDVGILLGFDEVNDDPSSWKSLGLSDLGTCEKLVSHRFRSVIIGAGGSSDSREQRVLDIEEAIGSLSKNDPSHEAMMRRYHRLNAGVAILHVGGSTEAEILERKDRVDDALSAVRAATEEGIIVGGGTALAKAANSCMKISGAEKSMGLMLFYRSCMSPVMQISRNCGAVPEVVLEKILSNKDKSYGFNARSQKYQNLMNNGVIDPLKVTRLAVSNASSAAINLLSVGCAIIND